MPEPRHLRNAPITEAIIDFRVKAAAGIRAEKFAELKSRLAHQFPKMEQQRGFEAHFELIKGQGQFPAVQDLGLRGFFFKDSQEKTIAQFRVDGFTLNRLQPYTSWEELFPQTIELWRLYCDTAKPEIVTRLAVRYINRIGLPEASVPFETYLRAAPAVPPELPQAVSSFVTRITLHDPETDIAAHVSQVLEANIRGQQPAIILDIDAFRETQFNIDDPVIERALAQLRTFKNKIFFNYITEDALRKFE